MSRSTFLRRFKSEFNDTAHDWMLKQTCQRIVGEIACPETTIKDLMAKFGFDSHSGFNRFCKANFHCTPSEPDTQIPQGRVMQIATQYLTGIHTDTSCVSRIARPSETPARHPTSGL